MHALCVMAWSDRRENASFPVFTPLSALSAVAGHAPSMQPDDVSMCMDASFGMSYRLASRWVSENPTPSHPTTSRAKSHISSNFLDTGAAPAPPGWFHESRTVHNRHTSPIIIYSGLISRTAHHPADLGPLAAICSSAATHPCRSGPR